MVDTRTSIARPPSSSAIRPSCGTRFSAISSRAITLIRETSSEASLRPGRNISCNVPSTRKRITRLFSNVSMWISEAPSLIASASMALISLMIGASSSLSSRSSVSGSSSARVKSPRRNRDLPSAGELRKSPAARPHSAAVQIQPRRFAAV